MPVQPTYPGVYVQEIPSGTHTIAGVATSVTGFVGYLRRGPVDGAVQCLNFADFQRVFGGLDEHSETSFQVSQFFLNGGSQAWISRLCAGAHPLVLPAAILPGGTLGKGGGSLAPPAGQPALNLAAQNPGTWGENVFVTVDYLSNAAMTFNLTATLYAVSSSGVSVVQSQQLQGVTLDRTQPNYVLSALAAGDPTSGLLAIADPNPPLGPGYAAPTILPFATGTILSFVPPQPAAANVTVTVTVQAPTPPASGTAKPQPPAPITGSVTIPAIGTVGDIVGAIQGALAVTGRRTSCRSWAARWCAPSPRHSRQAAARRPRP